MAATQLSSSLYTCVRDVRASISSPSRTPTITHLPISNLGTIGTTFTTGSPLRTLASQQRRLVSRAKSVSIRCEQSTNDGSGLDVWLGRVAMVGFAVAISVEVATGKGLLENFGLESPLPTVALAVTALVGVLTAIFIFQSSSEN